MRLQSQPAAKARRQPQRRAQPGRADTLIVHQTLQRASSPNPSSRALWPAALNSRCWPGHTPELTGRLQMSLQQFRSFLSKFLPAQRERPVKWGDLLSSSRAPELVPAQAGGSGAALENGVLVGPSLLCDASCLKSGKISH